MLNSIEPRKATGRSVNVRLNKLTKFLGPNPQRLEVVFSYLWGHFEWHGRTGQRAAASKGISL